MRKYANLSGKSGVLSYEIDPDKITIVFDNGKKYLYNYSRPGRLAVEQMKKLAISGRGLNTYINSYVRENYYKKFF